MIAALSLGVIRCLLEGGKQRSRANWDAEMAGDVGDARTGMVALQDIGS